MAYQEITPSLIGGGNLTSDEVEIWRSCWVPLGKAVLLGCGDDRELERANADDLSKQYPEAMPPGDPAKPYASTFGGWGGLGGTLLWAGTAAFGSSFVRQVGGYTGAVREVGNGLTVKGGDGATMDPHG